MPHYLGSAVDLTAIRTALVTACTSHGWTWDSGSGVLSKGTLHLHIALTDPDIHFTGRTSASAGAMPNAVHMGRLLNNPGKPTFAPTYPAQYEVFVFDDPVDEVWMVINYDVDRYQWVGFGKSVLSMPGTGMWVAATIGLGYTTSDITTSVIAGPFVITPTEGGAQRSAVSHYACGALAWNSVNRSGTPQCMLDHYVHSDLDGHGWRVDDNNLSTDLPGVRTITQLLNAQPSAWNTEAALIPARIYKVRPSFRLSLVADLVNVRHVRIDNYEPGQIIELGPDRWKVYPWHRKNLGARDGGGSSIATIDHTGTFGYAVRYDGE